MQHLSSVLLGAVIVAGTAAWIAAEVADPGIVFLAIAVVTGYLLDRRPTDRGKLVFVGYAVAAVIATSPLLVFLPDVLSGRTAVVSQIMTVVTTRFLLTVAGVLAYAAYRTDGGIGVLARARDNDARKRLAGYGLAALLFSAPLFAFLLDLVVQADVLAAPGASGWRGLGVLAVGIAAGLRLRPASDAAR
jgi:hypothetical protein